MRALDRSGTRPHQPLWRVSSLVTLTVVLSPVTVAACPTCFGSVSQQVLYTYYLSAVFLTLMPFFVLSMLGTWIVRHHRKQRTNAGMPGPVPPRSAR